VTVGSLRVLDNKMKPKHTVTLRLWLSLGLIGVMCVGGCVPRRTSSTWDLTNSGIPTFFSLFDSVEGASINIRGLHEPLLMTEEERKGLIKSLKEDTRFLNVDESEVRGASYRIIVQVTLFRGPNALLIGLDQLGFGVGPYDEFRFVNPSLSRVLEQVFRRNGLLDSEFADWYREMLAKGAAGPLPDPTDVRYDASHPDKPRLPISTSHVALEAIEGFLRNCGDQEVMVRVRELTGGDYLQHDDDANLPEIKRQDMPELIRALVEDSWPCDANQAFVYPPGRRDGFEITVCRGLCACVIWFDQSGFFFGKDGQYRFENPRLAKGLEKAFEESGAFDSADGPRYKRMLAAGAGEPRSQTAKEARLALQKMTKAGADANAQGPAESPQERARVLGSELLQDPSRRLQGHYLFLVADRLADTGRSAVPYLVKGLESEDAVVRKLAAFALAKIGPDAKEAAEALAKAMAAEKDNDVESKIAAAIARVGPPSPQSIPGLLEVLTKRGDYTVVAFCDALVAIGAPAVPALVVALESSDRGARYRAAQALARMGPAAKAAVSALVTRIKVRDTYTDLMVDEALARIGTPSIPALMEAAQAGDHYVQWHAGHALGQMGPEAVGYLTAALKKDNPVLRAVAAEALGNIKPPARNAVPDIIAVMNDRSDDVRASACESLGRIGDSRAFGAVLAAVKDRNRLVRARAADALGTVGAASEETIKALIELLLDKDKLVRTSAAESLGQIGPKAHSAIPELERLSETDDDPLTREYSRDALKSIRMPEKKKL